MANGTAGYAIISDGNIRISGGAIISSNSNSENAWSAIRCVDLIVSGNSKVSGKSGSGFGVLVTGDLIQSGGSITGETTDPDSDRCAVYCAGNASLENGEIIANTECNFSFHSHQLNMKSGSLTSKNGALDSPIITIEGGSLTVVSNKNYAIRATDITVNGGNLSAKCQAEGECIKTETFEMNGGKVTASLANADRTAILVPSAGFKLANDIWMSVPSDGYIKYDTDNLEAFKPDGSHANEMTLQKASSISVKSGTMPVFYEGDEFDPKGIVLNVGFVDGSTADLSINDAHRDMFSFSPAENEELPAGNVGLIITALNRQASTTIPVKKLGTTELSGSIAGATASLSWTKADGAYAYNVYFKDRKSDRYRFFCSTSETSCKNTDIPSGAVREYYVEVYRRAKSGKEYTGKEYTTESNHITLTTGLATPQPRLTDTGYDSLTLKWDAIRDADEYEISRSNESGSYSVVSIIPATSYDEKQVYVDQNLTTGKTYRYYVTATIPELDIRSDDSNYVKGTPSFDGATTLTVTNAENGYVLSWKSVDGATDYEIWRGEGKDGTQTRIATAKELSYTDDRADIYSVYNYMVKATRVIGEETFYSIDSNVEVTVAGIRPGSEKDPEPEPTPDEQIGSLQNDSDPKDAIFNLLQARAASTTKKTIRLRWNKVSGANKYIIYGNKCGRSNRYKKLATVGAGKTGYNVTKAAGRKLKKGTYYKFIIVAADKNGKAITTSKTIHVATKGGRKCNDKTVIIRAKVNAKGKKIGSYKKLTTVSLKTGKKLKIKATAVPESRKLKVNRHRKVAFETSNKKVATVNNKGVIQAKSRGTCYIYAYAQNGVCSKLKVSVK